MPDITPRAKVSPAVWHRLSHPKITPLPAQALPGLAPAPRWHRHRAGTGTALAPAGPEAGDQGCCPVPG